MKKVLSALLVLAMVLALLPFGAAAAETVTAGYEFLFSAGNDVWDAETGWTTGTDSGKGLWVKSAQTDGASAAAAYVGEKLCGEWIASAKFNVISENNGGRSVSRMQLLDEYNHAKVIFTMEVSNGNTAFTLQAAATADAHQWTTLWSSGWTSISDSVFTVALSGDKNGALKLTIHGDSGYTYEQNYSLASDVAAVFCYLGFAAEKTTTSFENISVDCSFEGYDAAAEAKIAYDNLVKNYIDPATNATYSLDLGLPRGYVTNTGVTVALPEPGGLWDVSILLMAMDTYAQTLDENSDEYRAVATVISNSVNRFIDGYTESVITTVNSGPLNWAMDDCGWNIMALLLGYRYNSFLGNSAKAATCLDYAKKLFNNTYTGYYDERVGGGLWYNGNKETKSLYAATVALAGLEIYALTQDAQVYNRSMKVYNGVENNLRRSDGLYAMSISASGVVEGADNPYGISEGGSCTYLGGNMAMAVLNARLGNTQKAIDTAWGIAMFETTAKGAYLNDRDAWNNTFFLGMFQRELVNTGLLDARYNSILLATAQTILENAVFDDGYYSAAWEGPKEPSSDGYPADYAGERNNWGVQEYGWCTGSFPKQSYTSATTAHILIAAAAIDASAHEPSIDDFGWDTDEINGKKDFSGWISTNGTDIMAIYDQTTGNHRIWKSLLTDQENFTITMDVDVDASSSAYIKLLGQTLELDGRNGNGNQIGMKVNGQFMEWQDADDCTASLEIIRTNGGEIIVNFVGNGQAISATYVMNPSEESENLELGLYAGEAFFSVTEKTSEEGGEDAPTDSDKTPADFGWYTDNSNYQGWTISENGSILEVSYDGTNSKRVWKPVIEDPENFQLSLTVKVLAVRAYVQVLGTMLELNPSGGNGDQIYSPDYGNWFNAQGQEATVTLSRSNGGNLSVTYAGKNGDTISFTVTPRDGSNTNLELGVIDNGGSARFTYLPGAEGEGGGNGEQPPVLENSPAKFGWLSDSDDFSGWTSSDGTTISVTKSEATNHRIWKALLTDQNNFKLEMDVTNDNTSSTYIKVLGVTLELNSSGGDGNQTFLKVNGTNYDWLSGTGCKFHVSITRVNGGNLAITVTGTDNDTPFTVTVTPTENSENVEIGLYRGVTTFANITVTDGTEEEPEAPTEKTIKIGHTVSFDSDLRVNYRVKYTDLAGALPNYVTEGAYLVVEKDLYLASGGTSVTTVTLYPDLVTDENRMVFSLGGIQSVEMGSELRAVLHVFDADGNEYYTPVDVYSVLTYATANIPATTNAAFRTLLVDLLNYGASAQLYFGRNTDNLVNAGIDAYQQYATTALSEELNDGRTYIDNDREITAVTAMGFSVVFADKTEMTAKLTLASGYSKSDITCVKVLNSKGEVVETITNFTEASDGRLQVTYYGVKSIQMREMFQFVAYVGDKVASQNVAYSVEAYAKSNVNSVNAKLGDMVLKCMYYGDSAYAYFKK